MDKDINGTMKIEPIIEDVSSPQEIILDVFRALEERGYDSVSQIVGYILSGDPTYITSHKKARTMIREIERDEIIEELLKSYLEKFNK